MVPPALLSAVAGLALGLSLIAAIGAQNAFVLRQGLLGEHVAAVVAVCVVSDIALIAAGVGGAGAAMTSFPAAVEAVRVGGAVFLLGYGFMAARRAARPQATALLVPGQAAEPPGARRGVVPVLVTCLALTWLNPHVYLDTVVLLGSVAAGQGEHRWWFGAGASTASVLWFCLLGRGAVLLRPVVARPGAWRVIDGIIATIMTALGIGLLVT